MSVLLTNKRFNDRTFNERSYLISRLNFVNSSSVFDHGELMTFVNVSIFDKL